MTIEEEKHELAEKLSKLVYPDGTPILNCVFVAQQEKCKDSKGKLVTIPIYPDTKANIHRHIKYSQENKCTLYLRCLNDIRRVQGQMTQSGGKAYKYKEYQKIRLVFQSKGKCVDVDYVRGCIWDLIYECGHRIENRSGSFQLAFESEYKGHECIRHANDCLFYVDIELCSDGNTKDNGCPKIPVDCPDEKYKFKYTMCDICCCDEKEKLGTLDECNLQTDFDTGIELQDRCEYIVSICRNGKLAKQPISFTSTGVGGNLILDFSEIFSDICNTLYCFSMLIEKKNSEETVKVKCYEFDFERTC